MLARNKSYSSILYDTINYLLLFIFLLIMLYPFYYCVMLSFNDGLDAQKGGIYFLPRMFTLENYINALSDPLILTAARNTILRTLIGTVIAVFFTAMYAYGISRPRVLFKKTYLIFGLVTMYFSGGLIPYYLQIRRLGLFNNFLVYILPLMFVMYYALIFMSFFKTLPASLEESAKIDGANELFVFVRIIIPLSKPVLAAVSLFVAVQHWNSWFDNMIFVKSENLETLSHRMMRVLHTQRFLEEAISKGGQQAKLASRELGVTTNSMQLAIMVLSSFPIVVLYPFLQKYFIKGIMIGSIKG